MKKNITYILGVVLLGALTGIVSTGAINPWTVMPVSPSGSPGSSLPAGSPGGSFIVDPDPADGRPEVPAETGTRAETEKIEPDAYPHLVKGLYEEIPLAETGLKLSVFSKALTGFYNLKAAGRVTDKRKVLSIVDFAKPSREKRLWIIDLEEKRLLYHTLVAHGQGSGGAMATRFSNTTSSHQSSLGFYVTGEVYHGKHGRSLRLDGMDSGFNSKARERAIVLHGADYVSQSFIRQAGRLGRSFGCPAVPVSLCNGIIDQIKGKTVLFIHGPGDKYHSAYLDTGLAAVYSRAAMDGVAAFKPFSTSLSRP